MIKTLLKTTIGIILFVLLFYFVDINKLIETFKNISFFDIALLLLISFLLVFISTLKWSLLVNALGEKIKLLSLYSLYLKGYFVNLFLPSFLGGDFVRSYVIGKKVGQHEALCATFLERFTGFFAMLFLGFIFIFFVDFVTIQIKIAVILLFVLCVFACICSLSPLSLKILSKFPFSSLFLPHLEKIQSSLLIFKNDKLLIFKTFLLSFIFHSVTVVNTMVAGYAIGWENPSALGIFVVLPLIFLIGVIPISPQGLGIQEGAFVYFLEQIGATGEQALSVALILRAKSYILGLIGGVLYFFDKKQPKKENF